MRHITHLGCHLRCFCWCLLDTSLLITAATFEVEWGGGRRRRSFASGRVTIACSILCWSCRSNCSYILDRCSPGRCDLSRRLALLLWLLPDLCW